MKWKLSHFSQIKVKAVFESLQGLHGAGVKVAATIVLDIHGEETRSILDREDMQTAECFCNLIEAAFGLLAPVAVS
jgi:Holliday junction resolvasome RuvABC DNA-binding subunit